MLSRDQSRQRLASDNPFSWYATVCKTHCTEDLIQVDKEESSRKKGRSYSLVVRFKDLIFAHVPFGQCNC